MEFRDFFIILGHSAIEFSSQATCSCNLYVAMHAVKLLKQNILLLAKRSIPEVTYFFLKYAPSTEIGVDKLRSVSLY